MSSVPDSSNVSLGQAQHIIDVVHQTQAATTCKPLFRTSIHTIIGDVSEGVCQLCSGLAEGRDQSVHHHPGSTLRVKVVQVQDSELV